ncbi:hypothetical protein NC653_006402 [Populus alba x Populus x berolinensis]|nr:hypothetical protein NC653_006402 [Populus alba x Populus x berolinensis]
MDFIHCSYLPRRVKMGILGYRELKACLEIPGNAFWIWKALLHSSVGRGNALTAEEWALK